MKYKLSDYKGKHFILQDELDPDDPYDVPFFPLSEIDDKDITDEWLQEHVNACIWYGIPAYNGNNKKLHERINKLYEKYEDKE